MACEWTLGEAGVTTILRISRLGRLAAVIVVGQEIISEGEFECLRKQVEMIEKRVAPGFGAVVFLY